MLYNMIKCMYLYCAQQYQSSTHYSLMKTWCKVEINRFNTCLDFYFVLRLYGFINSNNYLVIIRYALQFMFTLMLVTCKLFYSDNVVFGLIYSWVNHDFDTGYRDANAILSLVPDQDVFIAVLKIVKYWAKC